LVTTDWLKDGAAVKRQTAVKRKAIVDRMVVEKTKYKTKCEHLAKVR
jgi:hypothetical protein